MKRLIAFFTLVLIAVFLGACTRTASTSDSLPATSNPSMRATLTAMSETSTPTTRPATQIPVASSTPPPAETPTPGALFIDVPMSDPDREAIERAYTRGILPACNKNQTDPLTFCPEEGILRGEAFIAEVRAMKGSDYVPPEPLGFFWDLYREQIENPEEPEAKVFYEYARYAEELWRLRALNSCRAEVLATCHYRNLSRAEATEFLLRLIHDSGYEPTKSCSLFRDVPNGVWYNKWVCEFVVSPFFDINRMGLEGFRPNDPATKRDLAVWFDTALEYRSKSP